MVDAESGEPAAVALSHHVIVAGYGEAAAAARAGAARFGGAVRHHDAQSGRRAREAEAEQLLVLRGDSGRQHTLNRAGIERAASS